MNSAEARRGLAGMSPRARARMAGLFELLEALASAFGQVIVLDRLVVSGNAAATAANLLAHERLFRWGFVSSLLAVPFHLAWALLFYQLFKPVNRSVSRLATFVILVGCALQAVTALLYFAPLLVLQPGTALGAWTPAQLQALAYLLLRLNGQAFNVYLVFFGLWCVLIGYLMFRSRFLPRILGVLLAIDGVGWMLYLWPPLAYRLFPVIAAASGVSEFPLMLWLIVVGVNERRWTEQAAAARGSVTDTGG